MLRIVFLCSGNGGNLKFIFEVMRLGLLGDAKICGVITDRECSAGRFAVENGIPLFMCDFSEEDQAGVVTRLRDLEPGIIITNIHKILSPALVNIFQGKLINLHYSLLPAFNGVIGVKALTQALDYGVQIVGTTVHLVDDFVDAGPPLVQAAIPVVFGDDVPTLMDILFRAGCLALLSGMQRIIGCEQMVGMSSHSTVAISSRTVLFSPPLISAPAFLDELFWERLR